MSPLVTLWVFFSSVGIMSLSPTDSILVVRLLAALRESMLTPKRLAIE